MDPVFWHRALYGAYVSLMNAFFWIPKEEQAVPPEAIDKVGALVGDSRGWWSAFVFGWLVDTKHVCM